MRCGVVLCLTSCWSRVSLFGHGLWYSSLGPVVNIYFLSIFHILILINILKIKIIIDFTSNVSVDCN